MRLNTENITLPYEQGIDNCVTENTFDSYGNILDINEKLPEIVEEQFIQGGEGNDVELYPDEQFMQGGEDKSIQDQSIDNDSDKQSYDSDGGEYNDQSIDGGDSGNEDYEQPLDGGDSGNEQSIDGGQLNNEIKTIIIT